MPELPDLTLYVEALQARLLGVKLERVRLTQPFLLRTARPPLTAAHGRSLRSVERLGKRIVLGLDGDLFLLIHLMVAGRLHWRPHGAPVSGKHGLAAFDFEAGTLILTEAGSTRRASLHVAQGRAERDGFHAGGIEPLDADRESFRAALLRERHTVKRTLTDPRLFSGIGNAYSDEILHRARLSPVTLTTTLGEQGIIALHQATRDVLSEWIARLRAQAAGAFPEKVTAFREGMAVHGRYRQPCPVCGAPVQRIVRAEHETNYCPTCQTGGTLLADRALSRLLKEDWPRTLEELGERRKRSEPEP